METRINKIRLNSKIQLSVRIAKNFTPDKIAFIVDLGKSSRLVVIGLWLEQICVGFRYVIEFNMTEISDSGQRDY